MNPKKTHKKSPDTHGLNGRRSPLQQRLADEKVAELSAMTRPELLGYVQAILDNAMADSAWTEESADVYAQYITRALMEAP